MQKKPDHSFVKGGLDFKEFSQGPDSDCRVKGLHGNSSLQVHLSLMMIPNIQVKSVYFIVWHITATQWAEQSMTSSYLTYSSDEGNDYRGGKPFLRMDRCTTELTINITVKISKEFSFNTHKNNQYLFYVTISE